MDANQERFLINEYGNSRIQPYSYSFGQYDIIVPFAYASPFESFDALEKKLFDKYLPSGGKKFCKECEKYAKLGLSIPKLRMANLLLIKPFRMRDLSDAEALKRVTAEAYKRYLKAVDLALKLHNADPLQNHQVKIGTDDVKKLSVQYEKLLLDKFGDKVLVSAAKVGSYAGKKGKFLKESVNNLSAEKFADMTKKYIKKLSRLKAFYEKNKSAAKIALPITLSAFLVLGSSLHGRLEQRDDLKFLSFAQTVPQKNNVESYSLSKYVAQHLDSLGLGMDKLNAVQKHNLDIYLKTHEERDIFIAFAEDFQPVGIDDQKGYGTNGYGSTFKIDEKTGNIVRRIKIGEKTTKEKGIANVDNNSDFHFLPHLLTDVKVKLNERQMVVLNNFAHLTGPNIGATSFCEALNQKRPLNELCQHLARWNVDPGVPKRMFFLDLYLRGRINMEDILGFKPAGCYNNQLYDVLVCNTKADGSAKMEAKRVTTTELCRGRKVKKMRIKYRPSFKMKNGMPYFTGDKEVIAQCIENAKPGENEKTVADILPKNLYSAYMQKTQHNQYLAMGNTKQQNASMVFFIHASANKKQK